MKFFVRIGMLFSLFIFLSAEDFAQVGPPKFIFQHINDPANVSLNNNWGLYKDRNGFLWMGGLEGLQMFDGFSTRIFKNLESDSTSISGNSISKIVQDNITPGFWVGTVEALNYFDTRKGIFKKYYPGSANGVATFIMPYCIDDSNKLWLFSGKKGGLFVFDTETKESRLVCISDEVMKFYPGKPKTKQVFSLVVNKNGGLTKLDFANYEVKKKSLFFTGKDSDRLPFIKFNRDFWIANDSIAWLGTDTGLIEFNFKSVSYRLFNKYKTTKPIRNFRAVTPINDRFILTGTSEQGLLVFDLINRKFVDQYLHDPSNIESISSNSIGEIVPDSNGNIFIISSRKGIDIIHLPDQFISHQLTTAQARELSSDNEVSAMVKLSDTLVWVATRGSRMLIWNTKSNQFLRSKFSDEVSTYLADARVSQMHYDQQKVFICSSTGLFKCDLVRKSITKINVPNSVQSRFSVVNSCTSLKDGRYVVSTNSSIYLVEDSDENPKVSVINCFDSLNIVENRQVYYDETTKHLFVLGNYGSFVIALKYQGGGVFNFAWLNEFGRVGVQFFKMPDGRFWVLTNEGLMSFVPEEPELTRERIEAVMNEPVNFVGSNGKYGCWIVQKSQICYFDYTIGKVVRTFSLSSQFSYQSFVPAANIELSTSIFAFGSIRGITTLDFSKEAKVNTFEYSYIKRIVINDTEEAPYFFTEQVDTVRLEPRDKTIRFDLATVQYRKDMFKSLECQLVGYDQHWIKWTREGTIRYTNLPAGTYRFQLRDAEADKILKTVIVIVKQPFWQTGWFLFTALISLAALVFWLVKLRVMQIRKEAKLKAAYENKVIHMEMQNLRSQMNPHFIFNSLNSINSFVIENETLLASDYLTKFSRLVRLILENSKSESISLGTELETLRLYLLMEGIRFEGKFEYDIKVESDIDLKLTKIPPMVIQPFAENAIWHGFMQKEGVGHLKIMIQKQEAGLRIEVEDDGIGRERAAELKSKGSTHKSSYGMQITEQRIKHLNASNQIQIVDLHENGECKGTRVTINLNL